MIVTEYVEGEWEKKFLTVDSNSLSWPLVVDELAEHIYIFPLFTPSACKGIIEAAEADGRWTTKRHAFYPTTDMLASNLGGLGEIMSCIIKNYVHVMIQQMTNWKRDVSTLRHETFIVKYTPEAQNHLALHHDSSAYSVVVGLNDGFEGGGTFFKKQNMLLKPPVGTAVVHPGLFTHEHGARPISSGTRYVIVSFVNFD